MSLPDVTSREQWLDARRRLLAQEKEFTRRRDALNADRRRLPMVRVDQEYVFEGPDGTVTLAGLFGDNRQLIVQHVMFGPDWDQPCPGCSASINELSPGVLDHLRTRETAFVLTSRAPYEKIAAVAKERDWFVPWYSSYGSDFSSEPDLLDGDRSTEMPGVSCFLREGDEIFHTYSTFARGTDVIVGTYSWLDLTALGRQEDWEEPKGRVAPVRGGDPTFTS
jgi:predicted dithiol-disulfide oxidoreductase (DUF899 family)